MFRSYTSNRCCRRGASTVEFALVFPLLIMMIFGALEVGRAVMTKHMLEEAARAGCRVASVEGATKDDAIAMVADAMQKANINQYAVTVNPDPLVGANSKTPVTVTVSAAYSEVTLLPSTRYLAGKTLAGTCTMPAENERNAAKLKKIKQKQAKKAAKMKAKTKTKTKKAKSKSKKKGKGKTKSKKAKSKTKKAKSKTKSG